MRTRTSYWPHWQRQLRLRVARRPAGGRRWRNAQPGGFAAVAECPAVRAAAVGRRRWRNARRLPAAAADARRLEWRHARRIAGGSSGMPGGGMPAATAADRLPCGSPGLARRWTVGSGDSSSGSQTARKVAEDGSEWPKAATAASGGPQGWQAGQRARRTAPGTAAAPDFRRAAPGRRKKSRRFARRFRQDAEEGTGARLEGARCEGHRQRRGRRAAATAPAMAADGGGSGASGRTRRRSEIGEAITSRRCRHERIEPVATKSSGNNSGKSMRWRWRQRRRSADQRQRRRHRRAAPAQGGRGRNGSGAQGAALEGIQRLQEIGEVMGAKRT